MEILAFAASTSSQSINKQLVSRAAERFCQRHASDAKLTVLDLNDFEMPIYSMDRENQGGVPDQAHHFRAMIGTADRLIVSFAEHNGSYTAAFKNLFDWTSRIDTKVWQGKPMLMLSASPGPGGARRVLDVAVSGAPTFNGDVRAQFSLPKFGDNFDQATGTITDPALNAQFDAAIDKLA